MCRAHCTLNMSWRRALCQWAPHLPLTTPCQARKRQSSTTTRHRCFRQTRQRRTRPRSSCRRWTSQRRTRQCRWPVTTMRLRRGPQPTARPPVHIASTRGTVSIRAGITSSSHEPCWLRRRQSYRGTNIKNACFHPCTPHGATVYSPVRDQSLGQCTVTHRCGDGRVGTVATLVQVTTTWTQSARA